MKEGSMEHPSIINTVLGPITLGPSSSHLAGPVYLGNLAKEIIDFPPEKIEIVFNEGSSFSATYRSHGTDRALIAGFLGWKPDNLDIPGSLKEAKDRGLIIDFKSDKLQTEHPNGVLFKITGKNGETTNIIGASEGGGAARIFQIDEESTSIDGQKTSVLVKFTNKEDKKLFLEGLDKQFNITYNAGKIVTLDTKKNITEKDESQLKDNQYISSHKVIDPVYHAANNKSSDIPLFSTSEELYKLTKEKDIKLSEAALLYEKNRMGWDEEKIRYHIGKMVDVMENAIKQGLEKELNFSGGIVKQGGKRIKDALDSKQTITKGTMPKATAYAMAVNEVSASLGLIVAAPTAGASGVIPGALFAAFEDMAEEISRDTKIDALLSAGAIGAVFAQKATFLAELCGCQVETGFATAMAAAAIIEVNGGTVKQSIDAASLTLQNILGMECDPVAGLMEVPCINRNALGAVNALMSSEIIWAGVNNVIPLDEVIETVYEVGRFRPMQCNGSGGLAITPTSKKLREEWMNKQ